MPLKIKIIKKPVNSNPIYMKVEPKFLIMRVVENPFSSNCEFKGSLKSNWFCYEKKKGMSHFSVIKRSR